MLGTAGATPPMAGATGGTQAASSGSSTAARLLLLAAREALQPVSSSSGRCRSRRWNSSSPSFSSSSSTSLSLSSLMPRRCQLPALAWVMWRRWGLHRRCPLLWVARPSLRPQHLQSQPWRLLRLTSCQSQQVVKRQRWDGGRMCRRRRWRVPATGQTALACLQRRQGQRLERSSRSGRQGDTQRSPLRLGRQPTQRRQAIPGRRPQRQRRPPTHGKQPRRRCSRSLARSTLPVGRWCRSRCSSGSRLASSSPGSRSLHLPRQPRQRRPCSLGRHGHRHSRGSRPPLLSPWTLRLLTCGLGSSSSSRRRTSNSLGGSSSSSSSSLHRLSRRGSRHLPPNSRTLHRPPGSSSSSPGSHKKQRLRRQHSRGSRSSSLGSRAWHLSHGQ